MIVNWAFGMAIGVFCASLLMGRGSSWCERGAIGRAPVQ
jgi:hypothetical protein